ncbi:MAG: hypothetical protein P8X85_05270 [Desulfobacterales bacterium]
MYIRRYPSIRPSAGVPELRRRPGPENGSPVDRRRVDPATPDIAGRWSGAIILTENVKLFEATGLPAFFPYCRSGGPGPVAITDSTKEVKIIFKFAQKVLSIFLFMLLGLAAGSPGVEDELT